VTLSEDAYAAFQTIKKGQSYRFVTFAMSEDKTTIVVKGMFSREKTYADFLAEVKAVRQPLLV
jgi:hypothetical protein